jgi:retinol dehydrogenase 12
MEGPVDDLMNGKICLVTGATGGIGYVTAYALAQMGATTIVLSRNREKCIDTVDRIKRETGNPYMSYIAADLSSQREVRRAAAEFKSGYDRLHVLVNNAGGTYSKRRETVDGIELTFALNQLAYFLLTNLLLDKLKAGAPSRIVIVSSELHKRARLDFDDLESKQKYNGMAAYRQSKLANMLFACELTRRLEGTGVTVNTLSPGLVATNIGLQDGGMYALSKKIVNRLMGITPEEGAQTGIHLATSPDVEGATGQYFVKSAASTPSALACDRDAAKRLWDISARMTGLSD